jgi:hypothetical protein
MSTNILEGKTAIDELLKVTQNISQEVVPEVEEDDKENIGEKQNPIVQIGKYKFDKDTIVIAFIIIFIWIFIWKISGLWKALKYDYTFTAIFFIFILYNILSITIAGTSSGGVVYELNILLTVEQMISILFGTMVMFFIFGDKLPVEPNCKNVITRLSVSIIIILTMASLWVNVWTTGRSFKAVRKFKQSIYNVALTLFIMIGLIIIKGGCRE